MEVETPVLSSNAGGANACPFVTKGNRLGEELYMRISPELYLKVYSDIDWIWWIFQTWETLFFLWMSENNDSEVVFLWAGTIGLSVE